MEGLGIGDFLFPSGPELILCTPERTGSWASAGKEDEGRSCGGWNKNGAHKLSYQHSQKGLEGLGSVALLEEVCNWAGALMSQKPIPSLECLSVCLSARLFLFLPLPYPLPMGWDVDSSATSVHHVCLDAAMLPAMMMMD